MLLVIGVTGHTGRYFLQELIKNKYKEKIRFLIREKSEEDLLKKSGLNYEIFYGDICDHNISKFIKMMDKMRIYPMIAGGQAEIQPVNARDLGRAYYQVLINPEKTKNKDYNLSGEAPIKIKNMLKLILEYLNRKSIFVPIPMFISVSVAYILKFITLGKKDIVEKVLRMNESRVFSNEEARKDFGYTTINFEEGIKEEVEQYKKK